MRFLVNIPGDHEGSPQDIMESVGLGEIARGMDAQKQQAGPAGHGINLGWLDSVQSDMRYLPDQQTWLPSLKPKAYWIGIWNDSAPTEEDLRRPDHRTGVQIGLNNGESWTVPTPDTLERFPQPDPERPGQIMWSVDEQFNWLVTDLNKIVAERVTQDGENQLLVFDKEQDFDFFCRLLQVNYRITPEVIMHLRLMSDVFVSDLMRALVRNRIGGDA